MGFGIHHISNETIHNILVNYEIKKLQREIISKYTRIPFNKEKIIKEYTMMILADSFSQEEIPMMCEKALDKLVKDGRIVADSSSDSSNTTYVVVEQELEEQTYTDDYVQE